MFIQIAIGTVLMLLSILVAGVAFWALEILLSRSHSWLTREPHRPKLALVLSVTVIWVLGMVTAGVWIWALTLRALDIFVTVEAAVYFSLVSYTTLGYGDVTLAPAFRILGAMASVTGILMFGLTTAFLVSVFARALGAGSA